MALACAVCLCAAASSAGADQYKSEVRELEATPAPSKPRDPKKLLEQARDPYSRALLLRDLAAQEVNNKNYERAAEYLEEALSQNALSPQAAAQMRNDLTALRVANGKPADVIKSLEPRVKNNPRATADEMAALGGAYLQTKRYKDALALLERAVAASTDVHETWLQGLYAAYIGAGREKDALPVLDRLVRRNPGRGEYWLQLSGLLHNMGERERALATLELASRQGHLKSADHRLQLVLLTAQLGAPFEAGSLLKEWMDRGDIAKNADNLETLAGLWIAARESTLAIDALSDAIDARPKPKLYVQLGQLLLDVDRPADAANVLAKAVADGRTGSGSEAGSVLMALGTASFKAGNIDGAREAFTGAARFKPTAVAAGEWLKFLELPEVHEHAGALARQRIAPSTPDIQLSSRLRGEAVEAQSTGEGSSTPALTTRQVNGRLTPVGAERDANPDGTIPAWTGGLHALPSGAKPSGRLVDPFPQDKPLFTITATNAAQYAARLSAGHRALLSKYPKFRMPVYETRRSAAYPAAIYDATQANIGRAKLLGSDALAGARLGFPFPTPQNGVEVMWNHRVRYRGDSNIGISAQAVVTNDTVLHMRKSVSRTLYRYANIAKPADINEENIIVYGIIYTADSLSAERPEFVVLVHESANSLKKARALWVLLNSIGKMLRLPPVGYDQVLYGTESIALIDMIDMYNGAFDRYVWKLIGKRELYIPYNSYRLNDGRQKYAQQLTHPTFNGEHQRYELHRVWVIEAVERGGKRHIFGKRTFYVDEDSWNIVLVENHDHQGKLWRFQEGHIVTFYETPFSNSFPIVTYDLRQDRYFVQRLLSEEPAQQFDVPKMAEKEFLPAAVQRTYGR